MRETETEAKAPRSKKKLVGTLLKVGFSVAMLYFVFGKIMGREGADEFVTRLGDLSIGWWVAAVGMQLTAIGFAVVRWRLLLRGQGIQAPWRWLVGSFFIGRFWGAFTPGGLGLDGWRLFDTAARTNKLARATAVTGVEKVLGQVAFGLVVLAGSVSGFSLLGLEGVLMINGFFVVLVTVGLTLLAKPELFALVARALPHTIQVRVTTMVDAVSAYRGKLTLVFQAVGLGVLVHAFNNMIYVCAAQALGVDLSLGIVFFGSSLQIMSTIIPASINGVGLREATAVALYTSPAVGLSPAVAVLIPIVGFTAEMFVSAFGTIPFMLRRGGYRDDIVVEDEGREDAVHKSYEDEETPGWLERLRGLAMPFASWKSGLTLGLGAGLLAGVLVGLTEASVVIYNSGGRVGFGVLSYGAIAYGIFLALGGAAFGVVAYLAGRFLEAKVDWAKPMAEPLAYARTTAFLVAGMAFALGFFRVRRDVFHEELVLKSALGLGVALGCVAGAGLVYLALSFSLRWMLTSTPARVMLRAWGSPVVVASLVALITVGAVFAGGPVEAAPSNGRGTAPEGAGNVLFIVVDTLRADHLPGYGYEGIETPNLDALADDAIRFDQAFANASWTRPSFASMLTGRFPSNHGVMAKSDQLSTELTTLPEALQGAGYYTTGFVTNFNVAPFFNFQQGFDEYRYLEPEYVLGADDAASKLLLAQFLRQSVEKIRAARGSVEPGTAYQDAEAVNAGIFSFLERAPSQPWFVFAAYMDPHDPYFVHPYSGNGYARAAHQHPDLEEADELRELYDGEIEYWDSQFGTLIERLKADGVYDDMTIIVTSDHGEEFGDHGGFWHGTTLYDEQVHVPLFVKLPGARRGGTSVRHWVQSVDLMPTLLTELGVAVPDGVQGGDLFEGTDVVYAEESHEGNVLESVRERRGTDEWKLITANPGNPRGLEAVELYRPDTDPGEAANLAAGREGVVRQAMTTLVEQAEVAREGAVVRQSVEMDEEAAERLRNIGYME
ncbi:MAG: hypothetical protein DRJ42_04540 [Deltaproteobacteria bacterium]|nr:MAG: hypothetical protein DRJ42_04540 [Deltaproteobacteria bacterium]